MVCNFKQPTNLRVPGTINFNKSRRPHAMSTNLWLILGNSRLPAAPLTNISDQSVNAV